MKQSSKRLMSMLLALVLLVAGFLVFFELIEPAYGDLQNDKGQELSNQAFLVQEQQSVNQAKQLIAQYQNDSAAQANLALAMPSGEDVAGALAQIYGIAQNNGIVVESISISAPVVQLASDAQSTPGTTQSVVEPMGTLPFQISASGSYEALKSFLAELETNIRIFDLTAFSLQSASGGASVAGAPKGTAINSDLFNYSITVVTYYQVSQ